MPAEANKALDRHEYEAVVNKPTTVGLGYQIRVSYATEDPDWDLFVAGTPGGDYRQTSLCAQAEAVRGWRAARVVVMQDESIVAGVQVLLRDRPLPNAIGYVRAGPLVAEDDPQLAHMVIDTMHHFARAHRIQYLMVKPPATGTAVAAQLPAYGFRPSLLEPGGAASLLLDLMQEPDALLAQMHPTTRRNIRIGLRSACTVREGTERDLPTFYHLYENTHQRQHIAHMLRPEQYYVRAWQVFQPHGYARLFLAEYAGEVVSAFFMIPFGRTVVYWQGGWSGEHSECRPNNLLHWTAILWAQAEGYHYYDFGSISREAAREQVYGETHSASHERRIHDFKLGFGGQVTFSPATYDYVYNPVLRWGYTTVGPKIASQSWVKTVMNAVRGRLQGTSTIR